MWHQLTVLLLCFRRHQLTIKDTLRTGTNGDHDGVTPTPAIPSVSPDFQPPLGHQQRCGQLRKYKKISDRLSVYLSVLYFVKLCSYEGYYVHFQSKFWFDFLNTYRKKDKILAFICLMKNLLLYFSKKNPSVNPFCLSFITNIPLWFTTFLTNTTFQNGGMHTVQHSQAT